MLHEITSNLSPQYPWGDRLIYFDTLDSTNTRLKELARQGAPAGTALVAGQQTGGRGRLGRSFHSPEGVGVYLSVLLRPECAPSELMHLTCATAVAMCDALEGCLDFRPGIKWTNDLVWGRQKLGGILTELILDRHGKVDGCIIGVGINCCQSREDFPPELQEMATSAAMVTGRSVSRAAVAAAMLEALQQMDRKLLTSKSGILDRYKADCVTLGKEVSVVRGQDIRHATALDITGDGALTVRYDDGSTENVNSGEVSIRGMYGYL